MAATSHGSTAGPERLQKVLAHAGLGSRRAIEDLIIEGRVAVNGEVARLGRRIDPTKDKVQVDGSLVPLQADLEYLLLNKPEGYVTTADDERGRPTVMDLVEATGRVWPVGRLDVGTQGALLVTNDGDLTLRLTHPRYAVPKTYVAEVRGSVAGGALKALSRGVELDDGRTTPAIVELVERSAHRSLVEITLSEGRNRQVRRMFEAVGHPVTSLVRTALGPLRLGRLRPGTFRRLRRDEVSALYRAVGL
ncbi:MAG: rRNA pseudouridine synthase [Actinomycetota bacterium]|nr:rRNA pseudouridine synthase [Actinomycetota bacterium]